MRPRSRRGFMATGVATTAVVALLGGVVVAGASPELPHHGPYGVGEPLPVDGGRADVAEGRFEVTVDAAAVMAAAAVDRVEDGAQELAHREMVAPGRVSEGAGLPQGVAGADGAMNGGGATPSLEVVIASDSPPSTDEVARALASMDDRVESVTHVIGNVYQVTGRDLAAEQVGALPGVVSAEVEGIAHPTGDPHLPLQWGLENTGRTFGGIVGTPGLDIGFAEASPVATGTGVVVAVVDSGIQTDHPDLSGRFWRNAAEICGNGADDDRNGHVDDCHGWDFVHHDASVYDPQGDNAHGTHVAGIIAATTGNGIGVASLAPGATIMPVKVFDGGSAPVTRVAAAIRYAVDNGADVINLSLGGDPSPSMELALDAAAAADVLVVAAAGNDGRDIDAQPMYPASYPHANMVTVGSHAADGRVSSFSNTGVVSVDVFAPGQTIAATYPGSSYVYMSGTSMAAPMVSAMAAVIAQNRATTSAAVLHPAVLDAVVTDGAYLGRSVTGGRVHAPLALGEPNVDPGDVAATFTGLADLEPGTVSSTITAGLDDAIADGVDLELLLARWHDGAPHAVVGHDATVAVDGDSRVVATDGEGRLVLELTDAARSRLADGALRIDVATDLPAGQYALAVLPVPDDGAPRRPAAAFFVVNDPAPVPGEQPAPEPGDDPSPEPDEDDSPAPAPAPEEPAPGDGTDPEPDPGPAPTPAPVPAPAPGPVPTPDPPPTPDREPKPGQPSPPDDGPAPAPGDDTTPPPPPPPHPAPAPGPAPDDTAPDPGSGPAPEPSPDPDDDRTPPPPGDGPAPAPDDDRTPAPDGGDGPSQPEPPVWPTSGPSDGGTWVNVKGSFDPAGTYYVHIGGQVLVPRVVMSSVLQVVTTASTAQGAQDVVVHGPGGALVVHHPAAFTFLHDGSAAPPPDAGGTPGPGDGPTPAPGDGPTPGPAPDDGSPPPPDDGPAPAPDDGPAPAPDDGPAPSPDDGGAPDPGHGDGPSRTPWTAGSPFTLPDGLTLDRIVSGPLAGLTADAWTRTACVSDPCDGVLVR